MNAKKVKMMRKTTTDYLGGRDNPRWRHMYRRLKRLDRIIKLHKDMGYFPTIEEMKRLAS